MSPEAHTDPLPRRILLKLSGELLGGATGQGLAPQGLGAIADQIAGAHATGAAVAVVLGGGNYLRGHTAAALGVPRTTADGIGMLGTLANALAVAPALEARGVPAVVFSALAVPALAPILRSDRARAALDERRVVLLAGGTGNPFVTTDTAAALRALELGCDLLIKGTKVDGVYSSDPARDPTAKLFAQLTYEEVLAQRLGVMDLTAITICLESDLPLVVLNATQPGSVRALLEGKACGTRIGPA